MSGEPEDPHSVFLSYGRKERDRARQLADELEKQGIRVWNDELELELGENASQLISRAIDASGVGIVLLGDSEEPEESGLSFEWSKMQQRAWQEPLFKILPVQTKSKVDLPPFLRTWQKVEVEDDERWAADVSTQVRSCLESNAGQVSIESNEEERRRVDERFTDVVRIVRNEADRSGGTHDA